jgi:hypothetical protein
MSGNAFPDAGELASPPGGRIMPPSTDLIGFLKKEGEFEMKLARMLPIAALSLIFAAGCSVNGTWKLDAVDPKEAEPHYAFGQFTLNADGTYDADMKSAHGTEKSVGTFTFQNGKLTIDPDDGEPRTYDAELLEMGDKLRVIGTAPDGAKITATMHRVRD